MCFDSLRQRCAFSLRKLDLIVQTVDDGLSAMETMKPLLEIHILADVTLSLFPTASLDEVQAMAPAWPHLTSFTLGFEGLYRFGGHEAHTSCPLPGLIHLGRSCSKLISLDLRIDESLSDPESLPALSHSLQSLTLDIPDDTNQVLLACLLDRLSPTLQTLSVNCNIIHDGQPCDNVLQMLKAFQAIREECRSASASNNMGKERVFVETQMAYPG
jgi:hypothetical protein